MHPSALFEHWQELLYFDVQSLSSDIASRMRLTPMPEWGTTKDEKHPHPASPVKGEE